MMPPSRLKRLKHRAATWTNERNAIRHLRRGKPTNHKVFSEAMAILSGDAMLAMACELVATDASSSIAPALVRELARAAGACGMIGGQVRDIESENQALALDELSSLHR